MKKIHGLDENVKIAGRITTIRKEVESGTRVYSFRLGTKTILGSQIDRYFINVYKAHNTTEELDISKDDFEWLRQRGIEIE